METLRREYWRRMGATGHAGVHTHTYNMWQHMEQHVATHGTTCGNTWNNMWQRTEQLRCGNARNNMWQHTEKLWLTLVPGEDNVCTMRAIRTCSWDFIRAFDLSARVQDREAGRREHQTATLPCGKGVWKVTWLDLHIVTYVTIHTRLPADTPFCTNIMIWKWGWPQSTLCLEIRTPCPLCRAHPPTH
jgi:hypothetical protein